MSQWWADCRYAGRTLLKSPLFTGVAILSIALGIGANTAVFTLLDQLLLRKIPVQRPDEIVRVRWAPKGFYVGGTWGYGWELSYPLYRDFREHNAVFTDMFGVFGAPLTISETGGQTERASGELVTGGYFQTLGIGAARGRTIGPDDDRVPDGHPVAVITDGYWRARFAADPQIVGRKLTINTQPYTIIGVTEPGFHGMDVTSAAQVFIPMMMRGQILAGPNGFEERGMRWLNTFARLKPGVTAAQATASLEPFFQSILKEEVKGERFARATDTTKRRFLTENHVLADPSPQGNSESGTFRQALWILMTIVTGVLLIACANVANLLLARGAGRQREVAIRLSLGATRWRIVRQLLVESVVLAAAGGLAGLALATIGVRLLLTFFDDPERVTLVSATPDLRILGYTFLAALVTGLLFGIAPALQSTRPALAPTLKDAAGSVAGGGHVRLRKALVVSQVALSLLLLIGAGLFVRSLDKLMSLDLGFKADHLVTFGADAPQSGYAGPRAKQYAMNLLERVRRTPGVTAAGFTSVGLLQGGQWNNTFTVEGYRAGENERILARLNAVSPGYFEAMGIPLLRGRDFRETDARELPKDAPPREEGFRVAIASESFVKKYITGDPLGRHVGFGRDPGTPTTIEIIGVVKDSTYSQPGEREYPLLYFPFLESRDAGMSWFYVRTAQTPEFMMPILRATMRELDASVPPVALRTIDEQIQRSLVGQRMVTSLSSIFSLLATLLAVVGLYGVMAYSVTRRTREIGVRMALGAVAGRVAWLVMREALTLIVLGVAIALPVAWWLGRYLQSALYNMAPTDPPTIVFAILCLSIVASAAGLIPAMRAARINPIRALRHE